MSEANFTPPPPHASAGAPTMSTPETLANIYFEPGATFEALRERPRFLVAGLILVALALLVTTLLFQKVSFEQMMRAAIDKNPRTAEMSAEDKERVIAMQTGPVGKSLAFAGPAIATVIIIAAGAAIYMLGASLMGGKLSYKQALSVWTYSSFAPGLLAALLSAVLIFMKAPEDFDFNKPNAGLLVTNLGALINPASPVLRAVLSWFDLFTFFGMFLAALGLRKVGKISSGSAWAIVIAMWAVGIVLSVARAALFGG